MFHLLKWAHPHTRMFFAPDEGGSAASSTPTPAGGDGGGSSVSTPSVDGGGAAPPEPAAPSTPVSSPSTEVSPWAQLGEADDPDVIEVPPSPAPTPPAPAAAPAQPVVPAPQATATPPVTPQAQTPDPTSSPSGEAAPQLSASDPVGVAVAMEQNRDAVIAHLAQSRFALSEADIAELESDAAVAVPKLLARAMLETQTTMYKFLAQAVPGMIQRHTKVSSANEDAEKKFFEAHKALGLKMDDQKHRETATRIATIYRRANPNIPLDQLIQEVGPMVAAALALQPQPAQPTSQPVPRVPAFRPAVDGGGGFTPAAAPQDDWSHLGQNFEE